MLTMHPNRLLYILLIILYQLKWSLCPEIPLERADLFLAQTTAENNLYQLYPHNHVTNQFPHHFELRISNKVPVIYYSLWKLYRRWSPKAKTPPRYRLALLYLCSLLIYISSDVALNPGPLNQTETNTSNHLCGYCKKDVTWSNIMSIMCDNCDQWYHADCQGIGNSSFNILSQSRATWQCNVCLFSNLTK